MRLCEISVLVEVRAGKNLGSQIFLDFRFSCVLGFTLSLKNLYGISLFLDEYTRPAQLRGIFFGFKVRKVTRAGRNLVF